MKLGGRPAFGDNPGYVTQTRISYRLEAAHAAYAILPRPATRVSLRFHQPTFLTFVALMTGWTLSFRHRFITELIQSVVPPRSRLSGFLRF